MITTIQLNENVKSQLGELKSPKETFEQVIINLIKIAEKEKRDNEKLMIEGCKEMAQENLKITKEWEGSLMDGFDKNEKWEEFW